MHVLVPGQVRPEFRIVSPRLIVVQTRDIHDLAGLRIVRHCVPLRVPIGNDPLLHASFPQRLGLHREKSQQDIPAEVAVRQG